MTHTYIHLVSAYKTICKTPPRQPLLAHRMNDANKHVFNFSLLSHPRVNRPIVLYLLHSNQIFISWFAHPQFASEWSILAHFCTCASAEECPDKQPVPAHGALPQALLQLCCTCINLAQVFPCDCINLQQAYHQHPHLSSSHLLLQPYLFLAVSYQEYLSKSQQLAGHTSLSAECPHSPKRLPALVSWPGSRAASAATAGEIPRPAQQRTPYDNRLDNQWPWI